MSDNYKDQDIEKLIFGGALASGSIEPSESFWNKAYENILQRESSLSRKRVLRWRTGFYTMAAVALLMVWYGMSMRNEVNDIKQQVATLASSSIITNQNITHKEAPGITENASSTTEKTVASKENNSINNPDTKKAFSRSVNAILRADKMPKKANSQENTFSNSSAINSNGSVQIGDSKIISDKINANENKNVSLSDAPSQPLLNSTLPQASFPSTPITSVQNTNASILNKKLDSTTINSVVDTINSTYTPKKSVTLAGILSKISVSAFYAPGITDDFLSTKNNDPTNAITANELKTHQDGDGTMAVGFRLSYDISDRWTIQTGCYYSEYSYNINPTVIHAQQQENGQVGYAMNTSSGTVFLPNSAVPTHIGDSIQVHGNSSRGYISIPIQIKYKFWAGARLSFYADGGFSVNMANYEQTSLHWENTAFQEGDVAIKDIYGLNTIQYSYNLGLGAAYLVRRGLSVYTEPFANGAVTSINKNTPVIIYPYFFGWSFGLTYHF